MFFVDRRDAFNVRVVQVSLSHTYIMCILCTYYATLALCIMCNCLTWFSLISHSKNGSNENVSSHVLSNLADLGILNTTINSPMVICFPCISGFFVLLVCSLGTLYVHAACLPFPTVACMPRVHSFTLSPMLVCMLH